MRENESALEPQGRISMNQWVLVLCQSVLLVGIAAASDLPDHARTPGAANPNVTQANINKTICVPNWTTTVRPSTSYTEKLKEQQIEEYGYPDHDPTHYEEDHLISLQLGGHPTDPKNLWPEPYWLKCGARIKDVLESRLKRNVCAGKMTLKQAQKAIANNWIKAYHTYVNAEGCPEWSGDEQ